MKTFYLFLILAVCVLMSIALIPGSASSARVEATVAGSEPGSTVEPERERPYRPYPAPTGYPGFRRYYQMRCYPGCHYGTSAVTPTVSAEAHSEAVTTGARVRPYRPYPAPTGYPGFRRYYQMRCYPGCHYGEAVVTPVPTKIHP